MFTKKQMEIMKILLFHWGKDDNITSLSFDAEKLTSLSNCLNHLLLSNDLLTTNDMFNRISLAMATMAACPMIFTHFNPNNNCLNLNFTDEEKSILIGDLETSIANKVKEIQQIGMILVEQDSDFIFKRGKVKTVQIEHTR